MKPEHEALWSAGRPTTPPPVDQQARAPRKRRITPKRVGLAALAILFVALIALGVQGWQLLAAIGHVENAAVVPLPTRQAVPTEQASGQAPTPGSSQAMFAAGIPLTGQNPATSAKPAPTQPAKTPTPTAPAVANSTGGGNSSTFSVLGDVLHASTSGDPGTDSVWQGKTSLNIMVLGIDRRSSGPDTDQNADVIMLAHLDLINKKVAIVSIPRDLLVEIPGVGEDKINSAYNYGIKAHPNDPAAGVGLMRDTIESVFDVTIDDYVLVDFEGFQKVIDAVGGIDINVPKAIHDPAYPTPNYGTITVDFAAGEQHMDGARALEYARTRHADSDDERRARQLAVLMALFQKGKSLNSLTKADQIITAFGGSVQTSFPLAQQLVLAHLALDTTSSNIRMSSVLPPLVQASTTQDGAWVYVANMPDLVAFVQQALQTGPQTASAP